jgi:hypothetical protein
MVVRQAEARTLTPRFQIKSVHSTPAFGGKDSVMSVLWKCSCPTETLGDVREFKLWMLWRSHGIRTASCYSSCWCWIVGRFFAVDKPWIYGPKSDGREALFPDTPRWVGPTDGTSNSHYKKREETTWSMKKIYQNGGSSRLKLLF